MAEWTELRGETARLGPGLELSYAERGDPLGVPLIFLHGYTDSRRSFDPLLPLLPSTIRAIAVSQRGHGDSGKPRSRYDAAELSADVAAFMDRLGIEHAVIAGHSMGSLVAQRFAIDHKRRTLGLVLLAGFSTLKGTPAAEALWTDAVASLADPVDRGFIRAFQESTIARPVDPAFFETVMAESGKVPAHVWRAALRGVLDVDLQSELSKIAAPTLILWGDKDDEFCSAAQQQALADAIGGARRITYARTGHALHWEDPGAVAADIAAFIAAATGPRRAARVA